MSVKDEKCHDEYHPHYVENEKEYPDEDHAGNDRTEIRLFCDNFHFIQPHW